jgi:hypothetical protein
MDHQGIKNLLELKEMGIEPHIAQSLYKYTKAQK